MENKLGEFWHTLENLKKPLLLSDLDYAVRENVKSQIQEFVTHHMDAFIKKGMTYDDLKEFQRELGLCPSILENFPREDEGLFSRVARLLF